MQAEVWVISRQTRTCGLGRGSSQPHFCSPAPLRTGSPNQHTRKHRSEHAHACKDMHRHTQQGKEFLLAPPGPTP